MELPKLIFKHKLEDMTDKQLRFYKVIESNPRGYEIEQNHATQELSIWRVLPYGSDIEVKEK